MTIPLAADDFTPSSTPSDRTFLAARFGVAGRYLLFVGADEERKNLERLRRAFGLLRTMTSEPVQLVICGTRRSTLSGESSVVSVGRVSEAELQALYHGATAFVLPSLLEGFGLPVLEAMASGTPVLCSNTSSLPEVAGDAALYF
ncbi:MAG: glycosyltransferase, partial [Gemmatimonadales bacterium]